MKYRALLELCWETRVSFGFVTGISGNLLSFLKVVKHPLSIERELGIALEALQGKNYLILCSGGNLVVFLESW